jgi:hypothetical protein
MTMVMNPLFKYKVEAQHEIIDTLMFIYEGI